MLTEEMKDEILSEATVYEYRRGACIDALLVVQRHSGWVDDDSIKEIATLLEMTPDEVDSVATFYNLICRRPVGRHAIRLCTSVSCWVMGYGGILAYFKERWNLVPGQTTADGRFTLLPNQCLGTCDHGPALMIGDDLHQAVDVSKLDAILARYE